jgi:hypothetical protein
MYILIVVWVLSAVTGFPSTYTFAFAISEGTIIVTTKDSDNRFVEFFMGFFVDLILDLLIWLGSSRQEGRVWTSVFTELGTILLFGFSLPTLSAFSLSSSAFALRNSSVSDFDNVSRVSGFHYEYVCFYPRQKQVIANIENITTGCWYMVSFRFMSCLTRD